MNPSSAVSAAGKGPGSHRRDEQDPHEVSSLTTLVNPAPAVATRGTPVVMDLQTLGPAPQPMGACCPAGVAMSAIALLLRWSIRNRSGVQRSSGPHSMYRPPSALTTISCPLTGPGRRPPLPVSGAPLVGKISLDSAGRATGLPTCARQATVRRTGGRAERSSSWPPCPTVDMPTVVPPCSCRPGHEPDCAMDGADRSRPVATQAAAASRASA